MCYFGIRHTPFGENFGEAEKLPHIGIELGIFFRSWEKVPAIAELILSQKREKRMNRVLASEGNAGQAAGASSMDGMRLVVNATRLNGIEWVRDRQNRCNARNPSLRWIAYLGRNLFRTARAFL